MTNEMLRAHVTGTAFALTLGKTHIAALVHLEEYLAADLTGWERAKQPRPTTPHLGNFTTGASGLITRGLVTHTYPASDKHWANLPFSASWHITPAGRLVLALLKECGIWQEYATNPAAAESRSAA